MEGEKLHIVMFPWLAFGHMLPFLHLAKLIAQKGHRVSYVSTPRNIDRLPKLPPKLVPLIDFVKLPLSNVENLPQNAEATSDIPCHLVPHLKKTYDALQEPMREFLHSSDVDWILFDFSPCWVTEIGAELGIKTAFFSAFTAATISFLGPTSELKGENPTRTRPEQFTVSPDWVPFPTTVSFRLFEMIRMIDAISPNESGVSDSYRFGRTIENCDMVAVRSSYEFDLEWLQVIENLHKKPVIPVGQMAPVSYDDGEEDSSETWLWMKDWLDKKEIGTVVFIGFGSESKPTQPEIDQIALGLEKTELPFFWIFRSQNGEGDPRAIELPEGFEERTKGRGLVWTSWAPQLKIVGHEAIGVYLTHSGWSSVVEAIQFEKSLVLLPCFADQFLNARMLEEKKMAYPIPRDEKDGSFSGDTVAESLKVVLFKEEGRIYREKIKEMKAVFVDKDIQDSYIVNLINFMKANRNPRPAHSDR